MKTTRVAVPKRRTIWPAVALLVVATSCFPVGRSIAEPPPARETTPVYEGPSAYSSLAAAGDGTVYLLFERGKKKLYESIAVARFNLAWLAEGREWQKLLKE